MHTAYLKLFISLVLALLWAPPDFDICFGPFIKANTWVSLLASRFQSPTFQSRSQFFSLHACLVISLLPPHPALLLQQCLNWENCNTAQGTAKTWFCKAERLLYQYSWERKSIGLQGAGQCQGHCISLYRLYAPPFTAWVITHLCVVYTAGRV